MLNSITKRDVAIVSPEPGTTRDIIEVFISLDGYPVLFFDTAGIREGSNKIEAEGIKRAKKKAHDADLIVLVIDCCKGVKQNLSRFDFIDLKNTIVIWNKIDLLSESDKDFLINKGRLGVSILKNEGLEELFFNIKSKLEAEFTTSDAITITRARHRDSLKKSLFCLRQMWQDSGELIDIELAAEEMRLASYELGRITGQVDVEDILDKIFSDFCIGK